MTVEIKQVENMPNVLLDPKIITLKVVPVALTSFPKTRLLDYLLFINYP